MHDPEYAKKRLAYFAGRKASCENKLKWYQNYKTAHTLMEDMRLQKCEEYRNKIAFYTDAVNVFGGDCK